MSRYVVHSNFYLRIYFCNCYFLGQYPVMIAHVKRDYGLRIIPALTMFIGVRVWAWVGWGGEGRVIWRLTPPPPPPPPPKVSLFTDIHILRVIYAQVDMYVYVYIYIIVFVYINKSTNVCIMFTVSKLPCDHHFSMSYKDSTIFYHVIDMQFYSDIVSRIKISFRTDSLRKYVTLWGRM